MYRVGTVILHRNREKSNDDGWNKNYSSQYYKYDEEYFYDIVDGQQRLITICLILYYLDSSLSSRIMNLKYSDKEAQANLYKNYKCIKNWFSSKSDEIKESFKNAFTTTIEVVVLIIDNILTAFQLFDSQNTRGKALDPCDLLKAYHLREMQKYQRVDAVNKWESFDPKDINDLFDIYLFPILNWSRKEKSPKFSVKNIDEYKGISEFSSYTYAQRAKEAKQYFQITEPFICGNDFFEMVAHYLTILRDINKELETNEKLKDMISKIGDSETIGFKYCLDLFKCAVLCYYDKFHNFDELAINKLLIWAFMLRVDLKSVGFDSINKYASGDFDSDRYSNHIAMFAQISKARKHTDIANILVITNRDGEVAADSKWNDLFKVLKKLNGEEDKNDRIN